MKKVLWLVLLLLGGARLSAQQTSENKEFRFAMSEPPGWTSDLNINHRFNFDSNDGENLLTFYKYKRGEINDINPMINVSVEKFGASYERLVKRYLNLSNWRETYYINHQIVKKPQVITLNGYDAITGTVHFKYSSHGTSKTSFRKRIYYILHENHLFKIVFIDDYTTEVNTALFDKLASSIKISKP